MDINNLVTNTENLELKLRNYFERAQFISKSTFTIYFRVKPTKK